MENTRKITLSLTQEEMNLLHSALCDYRGKLGNLMGQMGYMGLATEEAQALWDQLVTRLPNRGGNNVKHILIRVDDELHYKVKYISLVHKTSIQKIVETLLRELVQEEGIENDTFTERRRKAPK